MVESDKELEALKKENERLKSVYGTALLTTYESEYELLTKIIKIYSIVKNIPLANKEVEILARYMRYGYTKTTRDNIVEEFKMKGNYIFTITSRLTNKGVLVKDTYNEKKTKVCDELVRLQRYLKNTGQTKIIPLILNEKTV